uniref:Uncharacterized protein n=1 Tax=viral metagenome TaxID=1070528 RepID=A0A6M3KZY3_9ZZZZ
MTPLEYLDWLHSPWITIFRLAGVACFIGFFWSMISVTRGKKKIRERRERV